MAKRKYKKEFEEQEKKDFRKSFVGTPVIGCPDVYVITLKESKICKGSVRFTEVLDQSINIYLSKEKIKALGDPKGFKVYMVDIANRRMLDKFHEFLNKTSWLAGMGAAETGEARIANILIDGTEMAEKMAK